MPALLSRYATPFITGLFLVSLVTGLALFFHVGPSGLHGAHEILSLVLILPVILHVWKNWRPMTAYFRRAPMIVALVLSAVAMGPFLMPQDGTSGGRPPQFALAQAVLAAPPETVAPVLGLSAEGLVQTLRATGFEAAADGVALRDIAARSGKTEGDMALALMAGRP
ncbi:DUF4405 domain-containing protein [Aliigemmobacter aestuarii]|uniref:DUF4405 domain-containing protein n=1 Tax=Aliigemmobacter aestuarii TaxID=1445661 RepID=A0A4V3V0K3_9RHOB|nr:DUF4405 domain-containing protein [Gemmobacter aestuarii]THD84262.1 DUF4405 domain-containing protein [Gemmobacter aestuarii]